MRKKILLVIFFAVAIIVALSQLPVITGIGSDQTRIDIAEAAPIELSGKTLFISDLHLTAQPALQDQFNLDFSNVENVIIVGDFFDSPDDFWSFGKTEEEVFRNVLAGIVPRTFSGNIFYISALTHDPRGLHTTRLSFSRSEFSYVGRYGKFVVDGIPVVAYHGDQLHGGMAGGGIAWLARMVGQEVVLEKFGKRQFSIPKDTWVINGHSHVPGIDQAAKAANTGSFVGAPFNKFIFRVHIGTGILFSGGTVTLQEYEGLRIKNLYPFAL